MPELLQPPLILSRRALAAWPHLPSFWPGRRVAAGEDATPLPGSPGPFRPPRFAGREVPVALVLGAPPDPVGDALARATTPPDGLPEVLDRLAAARLGGPPGLPDPGAVALGLAPRKALVVLDPCDPARRADAAARLAAAQVQGRSEGRPVVLARDPFATGAPVLEGGLPALDPWTLLDAAAELRGASRDLALLALAAGVAVAEGPLAGVEPRAAWASVLAATRCADPFRGRPCGILEALDILALWQARARAGRRVGACLGVHPYKRRRVAALLGAAPAFRSRPGAALAAAKAQGGALLAWSASAPADLRDRAAATGVELLWLEDGFIRSAGLGAAFRPGASFAVDSRGPYYDPAQESDLEVLLGTAAFPPHLLARAAALRAAIVARGVTKYNLRGPGPAIAAPPGRRRILVPGQVEDDASVRQGGGAIRGNLVLLRAVRAAEPDAFLIYKPHPDIEAGFRRGRLAAAELAGLADLVLERAPMAAVLGQVEAVHTLTSLTGFEALLRALPVTCWGSPFYAGWGLTDDRVPASRTRRRLTLDELVAGALILYPRCVDPLTELPCPPELLLERIDRPELFPPGRLAGIRAVQGFVTRAVARLRGRR
ncbi:MAG TPA: beta-3-deoxy-D-manno-oct-2-ulosonic acid transferase [Falsiroseomonas sp.]|nr:beta-3-deoxy-D-manno-oct-2-ulosonic acid transferase [Falsiroseomonas sp.]